MNSMEPLGGKEPEKPTNVGSQTDAQSSGIPKDLGQGRTDARLLQLKIWEKMGKKGLSDR